MKPTVHNTRLLHEHLRTAIAQVAIVIDDLDGPNVRYGFDMGIASATDLLDATAREVQSVMGAADLFATVKGAGDAWPEVVPERMLFRPMDPVPVLPSEAVALLGERIRGVLAVTAAALRQGEVYVYSQEVSSALEAVRGMLEELAAMLGKVELAPDTFEGTIYRPNSGPSKAWPGEDRESAA